MGFRRKVSESPRIELTPMIDVVFLLLIFFMISTTFIERPGVSINLPEGGSRQTSTERREVQVYLTESGEVFLEREPISLTELRTHLSGFSSDQAAEMTFLLMADKSAKHGWVIDIMEIARQNGFLRLAIATDKIVDAGTIHNPPDK